MRLTKNERIGDGTRIVPRVQNDYDGVAEHCMGTERSAAGCLELFKSRFGQKPFSFAVEDTDQGDRRFAQRRSKIRDRGEDHRLDRAEHGCTFQASARMAPQVRNARKRDMGAGLFYGSM